MARRRNPAYDPRRVWSRNLAPLVTAAREGATHGARTAGKERERARRKSQWWRQRWLFVAVAGLAVAGAAGGVYQAVAKRRAEPEQPDPEAGRAGKTAAETIRSTAETIRSTAETGREKVTVAARTVAKKVRREEAGSPEPDGR